MEEIIDIEEAAKKVNTIEEAVDLILNWLSDEGKSKLRNYTPYGLQSGRLHFGINLTLRNFFIRGGNSIFKNNYQDFRSKYSGFTEGEIGEGALLEAIWRKLNNISLTDEKISRIKEIYDKLKNIKVDYNLGRIQIREIEGYQEELRTKISAILTDFTEHEVEEISVLTGLIHGRKPDINLKIERRELRERRRIILARLSEEEILEYKEMNHNLDELHVKYRLGTDNKELDDSYSLLSKKIEAYLSFQSRKEI